MSLAINTTTPEGIVMAADSRQSYRNHKGMSRVGSDSASKVFRLNNKMGLIATGLAFLPENGILKNISRFIEDFKQEINFENDNVSEVAEKIHNFFRLRYKYELQLQQIQIQIKADLEKQGCKIQEMKQEKGIIKFKFIDSNGNQREGLAGADQLQFIVAGFNKDNSHQVVVVYVPGDINLKRDSSKKGKEYGADWVGQTDVVSRIVIGFDPRIGNLPILQKAATQIGQDEVQKQLRSLEYVIQWGTMTLQDGIDFSVLAIETTTAIQRFSDGISGDPGDMPGVGGPVDVAVITAEKGFVWVKKKNLKIGNSELDLETVQDIKKGTKIEGKKNPKATN